MWSGLKICIVYIFLFYMLNAHRSRNDQGIHISEVFLQHPMVNLQLPFTPPACYCSSKYLSLRELSSYSPTPTHVQPLLWRCFIFFY